MTRLLLVVLIAAAVCMASAGVGAAATLTVDDDGGADFTSIQAVRLADNHAQKGLCTIITSRPID